MGAQVARHNSKVLRNSKEVMTRPPPSCNCQKSKVDNCPLPGACNQDGVVYQANIASRSQESYIGLAKNFKKRFRKHRDTMKEKKTEGNTTLSNHYWKEVEAGGDPKVTWKVLESNIPTYNPVTKICKLCIREKYNIVLNPHLGTLNSRQEMFAHCRHMRFELIVEPPD